MDDVLTFLHDCRQSVGTWLRTLARPLRPYRGQLRIAGLTVAGIVVAIVFFVVGALVRVLIGPVSLGPFNEQVAEAISNSVPGLAVGYDQAAIEWSREEHRVNLVVLGARVLDKRQRIIAQAPKAEVDLAAGPFLRGKLEVKRIALVGMQLTLVRTRDGELRLGVERDVTDNDVLERIREAIAKAKGGPSVLESFAVRHARLAFYDEATGAFLISPDANFQISTGVPRTSNTIDANVDSDIEISGKPAHLLASLKLPRDGKGNVTGDISFTGLSLRALGTDARVFAFLKPFDLKADITGSFVFENGTRLRYADLGIGAAGIVNGFGTPLKVRALKVVARYNGQSGRLLLDDASLEGDRARAHLTGNGKLDFSSDNALTLATLDLKVDRFLVNMPGVVTNSVTLGRISTQLVYTPAIQKIDVHDLVVSGGSMNVHMNASITLGNKTSPAIAADGSIAQMSVRDLLHYWPLHVGEGAREWINTNITAGRVGPIAIHADIKEGALDQPALPEDALNLHVPLSSATVIYIDGMSPLTNVEGAADLTGDTFKAAIASGNVGPVKFSNGTVVIPQLHAHGTIGSIDAHIAGSVPDILTLLDQKPLQYPTRFHLKPSSAKGMANADLSLRVPMLRDVDTDTIGISAKVSTTQFAILLGSHTNITNGTVNIDITNDRLHASGMVSLGGGAPFAADWVEDFKTKSDITTTITAKGLVDETTREALNFHAGDLLTGPVSVNAQIFGHQGDLRRANMTMDLTPTTVSMDIVNYHKPAGVPATAQVNAQFDNDGSIKTETLAVTGAALNVHGTVNFGANGDLARMDLPEVRAGPANDFAVVYSDTAAGGLDVNVRGRSADGTGLGRRKASQANNTSSAPNNAPFHYSVHLDRVAMRDSVSLSAFSLDMAGSGTSPQMLSLSSQLGKGKIAGSIAPSDAGRRVTLTADDAGMLIKGLFGFESMRGGTLDLNATLSPVALVKGKAPLDYAGTITIKDFKVTNQPFLARLFAAGSLGGVVDLLRGEGISFDKMEVPFRAQNDAITIHDARAAGPAIGITADGYIDRARNQIALKGTLAPVYGLNSVLGAIPILGDVLVSKKGEGIIGMTYSVSGDADQPNLSVNPLAALAPGILRRIFEGSMPVAPQPAAPAEQQPPANAGKPATPPQQQPQANTIKPATPQQQN